MLKMVMEVLRSADIEKILEVIVAVLRCRLRERGEDYQIDAPYPEYEIHSNRHLLGKTAYLLEMEWDDIEFVEVIADLKDVLNIDVYFESHGNTDHFKYDDEGDIYDDAIWRLYTEEPHDRRAKISA